MVVFFVISWCTSGVGLQVLPFIDNTHLGSIPRFQRFSCHFRALRLFQVSSIVCDDVISNCLFQDVFSSFFTFDDFFYIYCWKFNPEFNKLIQTVGHRARFFEK